jgi:WD40 repeat protein
VWTCDPATGRELVRFRGAVGKIASLAFTPDGKGVLAVDGPGAVTRWDAATGALLRRREAAEKGSGALAVCPAGRVVVSAPRERPFRGSGGPLRLWDFTTQRVLATIEGGGQEFYHGAVFSPDGQIVAVARTFFDDFHGHHLAPQIRLFEVASGRQALRLEEGHGPLLFSPEGRFLAAGDQVWDLATDRPVGRLRGHRAAVTALAFSSDGGRLASASSDGTVLVWDMAAFGPPGKPRGGPVPPERLWSDLASGDAAVAFASAWRLATDPERAVPLLRARLRPVPRPRAADLARLIADLDSDSFAVRRSAHRDLEAQGELAERALRAALEGKPSAEVRWHAKTLLDRLDKARLDAKLLQALRAVAVLERIGSPAARGWLRELASGADVRLTREAKAALLRLERRGLADSGSK